MVLRVKKQYKCGWCGFEFEKRVVYYGDSKKGGGSSQVVCPNCGRNIPTWEKQFTGNIIGRKHIHIRK